MAASVQIRLVEKMTAPINNIIHTVENMIDTLETAETAQNVSDSDLISRKAAIDAFDGVKVDEENCTEYDIGYNDGIDFAVSRLSVLPSAQPERMRGTWIIKDNPGTEWYRVTCSECGENVTSEIPLIGFLPNAKAVWDYCPYCGADMREVDE